MVESVSAQLGIASRELFESVLRDPKDRRRLYLTFATLDHKRTVEQRGFMLRDLHIRPSDGYVLDVLSPYGIGVTCSIVENI